MVSVSKGMGPKVPLRLLRAAALVAGVFIACDSPLEPFRPLGQGEVVPVNRLIEDGISGGAVRNYSFEAEIGAQYVVYLKSLQGDVMLGVADPATGYTIATIASGPRSPSLEQNPSNDFSTPLGSLYHIDAGVLSGDTARFQFKISKVNTAPESAPSLFEFGDTLRESINHLADVDMFYVHAEAGQTITAMVQPLGSNPGGLTLYVDTRDNPQFPVIAPAYADRGYTTGPMRLETRDYRFTIRGTRLETAPRQVGPYRFWSYVIDPAPEHLEQLVPPHVEVRGERIDHPDDVDEFQFSAPLGAEFAPFLEGPRPFMLGVIAPNGNTIGAATDAIVDTALFHSRTTPFQVTDAGTLTIRVRASGDYAVADTGAYRFILYQIDRNPETVASTVLVGDTVSDESVEPAGDIDEFTVSATPGAQLVAQFKLNADAIPRSNLVSLEVFDPQTGASLDRIWAVFAGGFQQGTTVTVPASGTIGVRVGLYPGNQPGSAPYSFYLASPSAP